MLNKVVNIFIIVSVIIGVATVVVANKAFKQYEEQIKQEVYYETL